MVKLTRKNAITACSAALLAIAGAVAAAGHGCGVTPPKKTTMQVGATVTLLPVPIRAAQAASVPANFPNVHLVVNFEGKLLSPQDNAEVWIYEAPDKPSPLYKFSTRELANMYKTTNCGSTLVRHLDNAIQGDALFCNNTLDVSRMRYFVLKRPGQPDETATSLIHEYDDVGDQIISIVIPFT